jgi:hypothetical protein
MPVLAIELVSNGRRSAKELALSAIYTNTSPRPLALAFQWNRSMRIVDAQGVVVPPGPGPVLRGGGVEHWQIVMPGHRCQRPEPLSCPQPAGVAGPIGWSYKLSRGVYGITLVFEAPPAHGFSQSETSEYAFVGRVESRQLLVELD